MSPIGDRRIGGGTKQRAYLLLDAAEAKMSTAVDISKERAVRELGQTEPADPARLMMPLPPSVESAWQSEHNCAQ